MTLVINDVLLVRLFLAHLSLFKMFTSMTSCDPLTVVFVLCIIPVLCCNHVWCDEQALRDDARVRERNVLLALYREVTANAGHPTQAAQPAVCIHFYA